MSTSFSVKAQKVKASSTLAITAKAKAMKAQGIDLASFGAGEPDFPTPKNICDAAIRAMQEGKTKYTPASGIAELRKAASDKFKSFNGLNYEPDQVVISNGGKQTLHNIFSAIINPGDEVIIPVPFWLTYPELIRLVDGVPVFVQCEKEHAYKITAEQLEAAVTDKTKAVIINTPNNPTGAIYTYDELKAIGEVAVRHDFYIVADEMYEILNYTGEKSVSIGSISPEIFAHTITSNGLSKSYSMTGWRVGYSGSSRELAKLIGNIQSHQSSNTCSVAQYAALEALTGPQDEIVKMTEAFKHRKDVIYDRICAMPYVSCLKPQGAFYCFVDCSKVFDLEYKGKKVGDIMNMADILISDYKTVVIPCADFGMADFMRLSFALAEDEMIKGLDRIEAFLKDLK